MKLVATGRDTEGRNVTCIDDTDDVAESLIRFQARMSALSSTPAHYEITWRTVSIESARSSFQKDRS